MATIKNMAENNVGLSQEEFKRITSLPIRKVQIGGIVRRGYFDEKAQIIYQIDDEGNLNGQLSRLKKQSEQTLQQIKTLSELQAEREKEEREKERLAKEAKLEESGDKIGLIKTRILALDKKKKVAIASIALGIILCIIFSLVLCIGAMNNNNNDPLQDTDTTDAPDTTAPSVEYDENGNIVLDKDEVAVIRLARDLMSGDIVTEDAVEPAIIKLDVYNQFSFAGNTTIFKYERLDTLIGLRVTKYLNIGQYLSADSLSDVSPIYDNPWGNIPTGSTYIDVPIQDTIKNIYDYLPGTIVHLYFMNKGESSTVNNLLISDTLTEDKSSIVNNFGNLFSIPVGERAYYFNKGASDVNALFEGITPASVRVVVSVDLAITINKLLHDGATVRIESTGTALLSETSQSKFYTNATNIMAAIQAGQEYREEQARLAAEEAARQAEESRKNEQEESN